MVTFIGHEREAHDVESLCEVLPIAPSTYYNYKHLQANPKQRCVRAQRDDELKTEIQQGKAFEEASAALRLSQTSWPTCRWTW